MIFLAFLHCMNIHSEADMSRGAWSAGGLIKKSQTMLLYKLPFRIPSWWVTSLNWQECCCKAKQPGWICMAAHSPVSTQWAGESQCRQIQLCTEEQYFFSAISCQNIRRGWHPPIEINGVSTFILTAGGVVSEGWFPWGDEKSCC